MKLTGSSLLYVECESDKVRGDVMSLCELLGLQLYMGDMHDFKYTPWVLINETGNTYQPAVTGWGLPGSNHRYECKASDFITANF